MEQSSHLSFSALSFFVAYRRKFLAFPSKFQKDDKLKYLERMDNPTQEDALQLAGLQWDSVRKHPDNLFLNHALQFPALQTAFQKLERCLLQFEPDQWLLPALLPEDSKVLTQTVLLLSVNLSR